jgi:hypothetical protein
MERGVSFAARVDTPSCAATLDVQGSNAQPSGGDDCFSFSPLACRATALATIRLLAVAGQGDRSTRRAVMPAPATVAIRVVRKGKSPSPGLLAPTLLLLPQRRSGAPRENCLSCSGHGLVCLPASQLTRTSTEIHERSAHRHTYVPV